MSNTLQEEVDRLQALLDFAEAEAAFQRGRAIALSARLSALYEPEIIGARLPICRVCRVPRRSIEPNNVGPEPKAEAFKQ